MELIDFCCRDHQEIIVVDVTVSSSVRAETVTGLLVPTLHCGVQMNVVRREGNRVSCSTNQQTPPHPDPLLKLPSHLSLELRLVHNWRSTILECQQLLIDADPKISSVHELGAGCLNAVINDGLNGQVWRGIVAQLAP